MQELMENVSREISVSEDTVEETAPAAQTPEEVTHIDGEDEERVPSCELDDELAKLRESCPDIVASIRNADPERYRELRLMGLSVKEAYLATGERIRPVDNKTHLVDSMPKSAKSPSSTMTRREMELARALFEGMSDEQIKKLYNKVKS